MSRRTFLWGSVSDKEGRPAGGAHSRAAALKGDLPKPFHVEQGKEIETEFLFGDS